MSLKVFLWHFFFSRFSSNFILVDIGATKEDRDGILCKARNDRPLYSIVTLARLFS